MPQTHNCANQHKSGGQGWKNQPKKLSEFTGTGNYTLAARSNLIGIDAQTCAKYDAAIENWMADLKGVEEIGYRRLKASQWNVFIDKYTDFDLAGFDHAGHLATINEIWKEIILYCPYDTIVNAMVDPGAGNIESSMSQPGQRIFQRYGICFRCDSREPTSVIETGFKPLYQFNPPPVAVETILQLSATGGGGFDRAAGFWIGNRDIVSQTAICVSRSLRGCGKFPEPEATGEHYIYAFKFAGIKEGFDTEQRQMQTGGRWLPGEKAFPQIDPCEIIAHLRIEKLGSDTGQKMFNWYSYRILDGNWSYTGNATSHEKQYLAEEIKALLGNPPEPTIVVLHQEDFVAGR